MIHLVCDCGALLSTPLLPGPREAICRACGKAMTVPDPSVLGLDPGGPAPAAAAAGTGSPSPAPPAPPAPRFDADERLDLVALEREASRLHAMGRLTVAAGLLGAGAAAVLPGWGPEVRVAAGAAALFAAAGGWTLFRGAGAACRAAVALAQRQREILRRIP